MKLRKFLTKLTFLTLLIVVAPVSQVEAFETATIDKFRTEAEEILAQAKRGETTHLTELLQKAEEIFKNEPVVVNCGVPANILGMISGDFNGLLSLLEKHHSEDERLICLGDYMGNNTLPTDCDHNRLMTLIFLLKLKIEYPDKVFLIKGVPEACTMEENSYRGLCFRYFDLANAHTIFHAIREVYQHLPVAVNIDNKILCVHGGPPFTFGPSKLRNFQISIEQLNDKEICPLTESVICSEPQSPIYLPKTPLLLYNPVLEYNCRELMEFFSANNGMEMIVAGSKAVVQGYEFPFFPEHGLVSICSSLNYNRGGWGNDSGIMKIDSTYLCSFRIIEGEGAPERALVRPTAK